MDGLTLTLPLTGRPVLVIGGGAEALGRLAELIAAGARVTVVADEIADAVQDLADREMISLRHKEFEPADLTGAALAVIARPDPDGGLRRRVDAAGVLCPVPATVPREVRTATSGEVVLVGGGPGDPGLITVAGLAALRSADVIVADRLAPLAVLAELPPQVKVIDVAKIPRGRFTPQERINELLVEHARAGRKVVRLKGGDNFVFGRGGEEWQACAAAGVPVTVIPGVSSAVAGPALAGIPVTHRSLNQGFTVVSAHVPPGDPRSTLDWDALARTGTALVILMGVATLPAVAQALERAGMAADTPAATVADAGLPGQRAVRGTLGTIADLTAQAGLRAPAVTVVGSVAAFELGPSSDGDRE